MGNYLFTIDFTQDTKKYIKKVQDKLFSMGIYWGMLRSCDYILSENDNFLSLWIYQDKTISFSQFDVKGTLTDEKVDKFFTVKGFLSNTLEVE